MKVCVVGAGAIGGMMAAKLAKSGHELSVIARGAHLDAIRTNGLKYIENGEELVITDIFATAEMTEVSGQDVVLLGVKAHQIEPIADKLMGMLSATGVLLLYRTVFHGGTCRNFRASTRIASCAPWTQTVPSPRQSIPIGSSGV